MPFSIPQPIPARSSHPVQANQRPSVRRTQSHTTTSNSPAANSSRFSFSQLLAIPGHPLHKPDIGDGLALNNGQDDHDDCRVDEEEEDECNPEEEEEEEEEEGAPNDSGHYSSDLDLPADMSRVILISKPGFHFNNAMNPGHLYGTGNGLGNSLDKNRQSQDLQDVSPFRYSHSHSHNSNSDGHNSINLIADNCTKKAAVVVAETTTPMSPMGTAGTSPIIQDTQSKSSLSHFQCYAPPHEQQQDNENPDNRSDINGCQALSSSQSSSCSPSASTVPSPCPVSTTGSQQAHRRDDAHAGQQQPSFQSGFEGSNASRNNNVDTKTNTSFSETNPDTNAAVHIKGSHLTHRPNVSIDTSKARLQKAAEELNKAMPKAPAKALVATTTVVEASGNVDEVPRTKRAASVCALKSRTEGQLSFGLRREDNKAFIPTPLIPSSSSLSSSVSMGPVSNSSTRPLMMASQSRLSSALPPTPIPSFHPLSSSASTQEFQSISPSSPRANPALVNSLEQLSVSWKAPEQTPSFPINRLHRSRTISSGVRPTFTSSFSSNVNQQYQNNINNSVLSPVMVTSSSYSSLPYSPAVAFLSNFVDVTAPRMAPDEEGEQVGDFIMGKVIGHGGFSVVREAFAVHIDGLVAQVAVKIVKTQTGLTDNDRVQRMLDKEIAIWSRLSHPNVLPFLAVEKLPTDTFVFCELCTGGHLLDYLMRQDAPPRSSSTTISYSANRAAGHQPVGLEESQARVIFNQVAEAVRYLHEEKRIVHRDIKLENILQHEDGTWKICDFGLAEYQNDEAASYFGAPPLSPTIYNPRATAILSSSSSTNVQESPSSHGSLTDQDGCSDSGVLMEEEEDDMVGGSLAYCSPEQLRSQKPLRCPSSDVWSLGVVFYALLTGRLPFQDEYEPRLQFQILNGRYEDPTECSAEARDLLKNMFRLKPEDRWRIGQVIDSPWCMGTTLESSSSSMSTTMFSGFGTGASGGASGGSYRNDDNDGYGGGGGNSDNSHAKMNNFFASFRF